MRAGAPRATAPAGGEAKLSAVFARPAAAVVMALASAGFALVACGGSPERSSSRFCSRLDQQLPALLGPYATQEEQDALLARYQDLGEVAPLAVEEDWQALTELVQTAITVAPGDQESTQRLADAAYATERAYRRIHEWVATTCGLTMPDPGGIETTTTTVAPPPETEG